VLDYSERGEAISYGGPMSHSDERCPTCDGTSFITRDDQRIACPTCSDASNESPLYVGGDDYRDGDDRWRLAGLFLGGAALVVALAFLGWLKGWI